MKISVVIPVGPDGSYLPELVESLKAQTLPADEIVLVDDGGVLPRTTNGTLFTYAFNPWRLGEVASRNIGTAIARNDWVFQASHDDLLYPDCLKLCAEVAEASEYGEQGYYYTVLGIGRLPYEIDTVQGEVGAHALFHRSLWARLGGYPLCGSIGMADIGFIDLVTVHGGAIVRVGDAPLYWHRTHEHNQLQTISGVMRELCRQACNETTTHWTPPQWIERFGYS